MASAAWAGTPCSAGWSAASRRRSAPARSRTSVRTAASTSSGWTWRASGQIPLLCRTASRNSSSPAVIWPPSQLMSARVRRAAATQLPSCWPGAARMMSASGPARSSCNPARACKRAVTARSRTSLGSSRSRTSWAWRGRFRQPPARTQDRGPGAPQPVLGRRGQRPGQHVSSDPGGLIEAPGRSQRFGGGRRPGQRGRVGRCGQLQCAHGQDGGRLRRSAQCLRGRLVQPGQRRLLTRMCAAWSK